MNLAQFITNRRTAKGWSKRRLALESGLSHTEIHRIESGERKSPSAQVLNALSDALGVPRSELLQICGYMESDARTPLIAQVFPEMRTALQQETVQKIVDGLARNQNLSAQDYDDLIEQMEMFLAYAQQKKNTD